MSAPSTFAPGRLSLTPHPDTPAAAVSALTVDAARGRSATSAQHAVLILRYVLELPQEGLLLPAPAAPQRADELWRHTCFECFVRTSGDGYCEFNFAPSTQWAAYRFDAYRAGMAPLDVPGPRILTVGDGLPPRFETRVALDLGGVPELASAPSWRLAISAVVEETDGIKSYWALAHPTGKPDFHHADSFAYELPA